MLSTIGDELSLRLLPVAVIFIDARPEGPLEFREGERGCLVPMLVRAAKGRTAAFDPQKVKAKLS